MKFKFIFVVCWVLLLLGCGSQGVITENNSSIDSSRAPEKPSLFNVRVVDWLDFINNSERFDYFAIGFSELIKRGEMDKVSSLWSADAALKGLEQDLSKMGNALFNIPSWKESVQKILLSTGLKLCSGPGSEWHFVGIENSDAVDKSITFRVMDEGKPIWCRFYFVKENQKYLLSAIENLSVNYSTNSYLRELDKIIVRDGIKAISSPDRLKQHLYNTKLSILLSIANSEDSIESQISNFKESQIEGLGVTYITWLLDKREYDKARSVADQLSVQIKDKYFDAYSGYWIASEEGDNARAINYLYSGLQYAPTDTLLFYFLFEAAVSDGNNELAQLTLNTLVNGLGYKFEHLEIKELDGGDEFLNSENFNRWLKNQKI